MGAKRAARPKERPGDIAFWEFGERAPAGAVRVDDPETLRVLYHPLRAAIVRELGQPRSVKDVGERLAQPVARLYHHVRLLEAHGLIRVASERRAGSNTERLYQVTARQIRVGAGLSDLLTVPASANADAIFDTAIARFADAVDMAVADPDPQAVPPLFIEVTKPLTHAQARRLEAKLRAAVDSVMGPKTQVPADHDPRPRYGVVLLMSPFPSGAPTRWVEMSNRAEEEEAR